MPVSRLNRVISEKTNELIAIKDEQHRREVRQLNEQHRKEVQQLDQHMESEIKIQVQKISNEEKTRIETRYKQTLAEKERQLYAKDREIVDAYLNVDEKVACAVREIETKHALREKQKEKEFQIRLDRVKTKNDELQRIVDNIPPELQGTAGEFVLLDELLRAFPKDDIQSKKVGKEMADVIHIIVTESGEKVFPPIIYDVKTGDTITSADIEKAKRYKNVHNTDCSIIVTAKGIRPKDCESKNSTLIGKRGGILLLHPSIVVGIVTVMRNFILRNRKEMKDQERNRIKISKSI